MVEWNWLRGAANTAESLKKSPKKYKNSKWSNDISYRSRSTVSEKNPTSKISWDCPFNLNSTLYVLFYHEHGKKVKIALGETIWKKQCPIVVFCMVFIRVCGLAPRQQINIYKKELLYISEKEKWALLVHNSIQKQYTFVYRELSSPH